MSYFRFLMDLHKIVAYGRLALINYRIHLTQLNYTFEIPELEIMVMLAQFSLFKMVRIIR